MSGFAGSIQIANVSVSTLETIMQLVAATNHRVKVLEIGVSFAGTSSSAEPADIDVQRQSSAGTSSALTPVKLDDSIADTLLTTARKTFTAEPSGSDVLISQHVHTQAGWIWRPPTDLIIGGGDRLGVRVTIASSTALNGYIIFEE